MEAEYTSRRHTAHIIKKKATDFIYDERCLFTYKIYTYLSTYDFIYRMRESECKICVRKDEKGSSEMGKIKYCRTKQKKNRRRNINASLWQITSISASRLYFWNESVYMWTVWSARARIRSINTWCWCSCCCSRSINMLLPEHHTQNGRNGHADLIHTKSCTWLQKITSQHFPESRKKREYE